MDAAFGLRYTRMQSWFPFTMHMGLNGRDWLAQQMTKAGLAFEKKDNCFPWIADFAAAQRLLDQQLETNWPALLDGWARESFPLGESLLPSEIPYYWSVQEAVNTELELGLSKAELASIYGALVQHA